jgi:hypothetical protein
MSLANPSLGASIFEYFGQIWYLFAVIYALKKQIFTQCNASRYVTVGILTSPKVVVPHHIQFSKKLKKIWIFSKLRTS